MSGSRFAQIVRLTGAWTARLRDQTDVIHVKMVRTLMKIQVHALIAIHTQTISFVSSVMDLICAQSVPQATNFSITNVCLVKERTVLSVMISRTLVLPASMDTT